MRGSNRYAGAMFLYGPNSPAPDLTLAMQFLIDDLRFDGRRVDWVALKNGSLRLRLQGHELVLALTDSPLPPHAFQGVLRPRSSARPQTADAAQSGDGDAVPGRTDLARGRVLHTLRHHPFALSVLLRPRCMSDDERPDTALLSLVRECRALVEPVIEAAPPAAVIWQPGTVAFTCEEFLASRAESLIHPGDRDRPLQLTTEDERPRHRPNMRGAGSGQPAQAIALEAAAALPQMGEPSSETALAVADTPDDIASASRNDRAARRSAGHLFGKRDAQDRPVTLPRPHRADARLAEAMRAGPSPQEVAEARARQRRLNLARVANVTTIAVWYSIYFKPFVSLF
ncbi:MAG: hypothetical protein HLUCCA12_09350 [Rhodobacteraceae bacterium HLUCCA12]|nr:MAG: hypothetical protein HLUCCA12_09350 [Rhodobacteraceae bacterium HLUCCA12]